MSLGGNQSSLAASLGLAPPGGEKQGGGSIGASLWQRARSKLGRNMHKRDSSTSSLASMREENSGSLKEEQEDFISEEVSYEDLDLDTKDFSALLQSQCGYEAFHRFLKSEFSAENLQFWRAVNQYKAKLAALRPDGGGGASVLSRLHQAQQLRRSQKLFERFIKPQAILEVNVDADSRRGVADELSSLASELSSPTQTLLQAMEATRRLDALFDQVQSMVHSLMKADSFRRFQASEHHTAMTNALDALRQRRDKERALEAAREAAEKRRSQ